MAKNVSIGKCFLCNKIFPKRAMTRHLKTCKQRTESTSKDGKKTKIFHLLVEGQYNPEYWLHIEIGVNETLKKLDSFLRDIWLECCGHLSQFIIEGNFYVSDYNSFDEEEKSMEIALQNALQPGMKFDYEYDFGSTTPLRIKVISEREGKSMKEKVHILARNEPPEILCNSCGKPATQVCAQCVCSGEGWLCDECAPKHNCGENMLLPVVNSPRVGECGYTGKPCV